MRRIISLFLIAGLLSPPTLRAAENSGGDVSGTPISLELAVSWAGQVDAFFAANNPNPSELISILSSMSSLNGDDAKVAESLEPVMRRFESAADGLLIDGHQALDSLEPGLDAPADGRERCDLELVLPLGGGGRLSP